MTLIKFRRFTQKIQLYLCYTYYATLRNIRK